MFRQWSICSVSDIHYQCEESIGRIAVGRKKGISCPLYHAERQAEGSVTGVRDIHSFNESEILLETDAGKLSVKGELLHVKHLDLEKGEAEIEGKIGSFVYLSKKSETKEESLLRRMFR